MQHVKADQHRHQYFEKGPKWLYAIFHFVIKSKVLWKMNIDIRYDVFEKVAHLSCHEQSRSGTIPCGWLLSQRKISEQSSKSHMKVYDFILWGWGSLRPAKNISSQFHLIICRVMSIVCVGWKFSLMRNDSKYTRYDDWFIHSKLTHRKSRNCRTSDFSYYDRMNNREVPLLFRPINLEICKKTVLPWNIKHVCRAFQLFRLSSFGCIICIWFISVSITCPTCTRTTTNTSTCTTSIRVTPNIYVSY